MTGFLLHYIPTTSYLNLNVLWLTQIAEIWFVWCHKNDLLCSPVAMGLAPKQSSSNWNVKHCESVKFLSRFTLTSPPAEPQSPLLKTFWRRFCFCGVFKVIVKCRRKLWFIVSIREPRFRKLASDYPETKREYSGVNRFLNPRTFTWVLPNGEEVNCDWLACSPTKTCVFCFPFILFS